MEGFDRIVEERIQEAMKRGEFDNLPGKGKPLNLDDMDGVPEDLRMSYRVLKNAGVIPEEMQLQKEIVGLQDLLRCCETEEEKQELHKRLNEKTFRFRELMEQRGFYGNAAFADYKEQVEQKLK